jgi:hypothetical protein
MTAPINQRSLEMATITIGFGDREMLWVGSLASLDQQLDAAEFIAKRTNADIARAAAEIVDRTAAKGLSATGLSDVELSLVLWFLLRAPQSMNIGRQLHAIGDTAELDVAIGIDDRNEIVVHGGFAADDGRQSRRPVQ